MTGAASVPHFFPYLCYSIEILMGVGSPDDNMGSLRNSLYIFYCGITKTVGGCVTKEKKTVVLYFLEHFSQFLTYIIRNYNLIHDGMLF